MTTMYNERLQSQFIFVVIIDFPFTQGRSYDGVFENCSRFGNVWHELLQHKKQKVFRSLAWRRCFRTQHLQQRRQTHSPGIGISFISCSFFFSFFLFLFLYFLLLFLFLFVFLLLLLFSSFYFHSFWAAAPLGQLTNNARTFTFIREFPSSTPKLSQLPPRPF